jgi:hypothetical protein
VSHHLGTVPCYGATFPAFRVVARTVGPFSALAGAIPLVAFSAVRIARRKAADFDTFQRFAASLRYLSVVSSRMTLSRITVIGMASSYHFPLYRAAARAPNANDEAAR